MRQLGESKEEISRRSFLKLGFAGIFLGAALPLLSGCLGEEEEEEEEEEQEEEGDDGRRRRRRRR